MLARNFSSPPANYENYFNNETFRKDLFASRSKRAFWCWTTNFARSLANEMSSSSNLREIKRIKAHRKYWTYLLSYKSWIQIFKLPSNTVSYSCVKRMTRGGCEGGVRSTIIKWISLVSHLYVFSTIRDMIFPSACKVNDWGCSESGIRLTMIKKVELVVDAWLTFPTLTLTPFPDVIFPSRSSLLYAKQCEKYCNEEIGLYFLSSNAFFSGFQSN